MGAQVAQHAADGVAVIVGTVLAMIDRVSAAAVRVSLEQAELTEKTLVIGQRDQAAREQRQTFQVNLRPGQLAANVAHTAPAPGPGNPLLCKVVANHAQTTVLLGQLGVLFGRFLRIEWRRNAAANVDDDALAFLVSDGERVMIVTTTAGIDESLIANMRQRRQLDGPAVVDGSLDRRVVNE